MSQLHHENNDDQRTHIRGPRLITTISLFAQCIGVEMEVLKTIPWEKLTLRLQL